MTIASVLDKQVLKEGRYVNNPNDSGGETIWGITVAQARAAGYTGKMKEMPREKALDIYNLYYVQQPRFDLVYKVDPAIGEKLIEIGINMGPSRGTQFFQRVLNVMNNRGTIYKDIKVDGQIGAITIAAMNDYISYRGAKGRDVMLEAIRVLQGAFYVNLAETREKDEEFIYGWLANRIR